MGGERASTTRRREAGKICAFCHTILDAPPGRGERLCAKCEAARRTHRVYAFYMLRDGWHIQFLMPDLVTPLRKKLTFATPEKVYDLAERGGASMNLETRQSINHGISIGRGGIWLHLTEEQFRKLK